jgi:hypothetical protein
MATQRAPWHFEPGRSTGFRCGRPAAKGNRRAGERHCIDVEAKTYRGRGMTAARTHVDRARRIADASRDLQAGFAHH